jgi:hypothetical protein
MLCNIANFNSLLICANAHNNDLSETLDGGMT